MRKYFLFLFVFCVHSIFAKGKIKSFKQFDLSIFIIGNPNKNVENSNTHEKGYWFLPDGINAHLGYGVNHKK